MTFTCMEEFIKNCEGKNVIKKVLIANNGIGAVKCIRSVRRWSYETFGHEREVTFVAMATPEDLRANAEYIRMADEFVHVPGGSNVNNYANVNLIVQIAQQYKVDAVWAGWGHASENPRLPNTLDELDIIFIGPPGGPMYALGDKIGSTIIAQAAGVPTISWNGDGLTVDYKKHGTVPKEVYDKANVTTAQDCVFQVGRVGLPVMIKASEGGGGKGIRMVSDSSQVETAFRQVQSEVPGSPIFVMKLAGKSRHLEVQLLADTYGQAIALSGRDCSVQRRHQKILEEGPPIAAEPSVWLEMQKAAVKLAQEVGYVNAGTVEYLYADEKFYFLELNPRLQVEHPVTEMITGINLPAAQILVSMGVPLHRIPDVRKFYGLEDVLGDSKIDFANMPPPKTRGHTIAARITAENPFNGFQPTSGQITEINFRSSRNVWGYFSVDSSGRVHEFADSQIGHVFAWGENREEARHNLAIALNDLTIRGEIRTTIEYLKDLIESDDYKANRIDTAWLDARIKANVAISKIDAVTVVLIGAAVTGYRQITNNETAYMGFLERGQLPPAALLHQSYKFELIYDDLKFSLSVARSGEIAYRVSCNGSSVDIELRELADEGFLVLIGGKSHVAYAKKDVGAIRYVIDGQTCLFPDEYDPTQMRAQMGGKLLRFLVEDGSSIDKGTAFAEIEVMKMNMQLHALESGTIAFQKPEGSVMEPGDIICTMSLADPSKVKLSKPYLNEFPALGDPWPQPLDNMPHHTLEKAKTTLHCVMTGFLIENSEIESSLKNLHSALRNPLLPVLEIEALTARTKNTLPPEFCNAVEDESKMLRAFIRQENQTESSRLEASAAFSSRIVDLAHKSLPSTLQLYDLAREYAAGLVQVELDIYTEVLQKYAQVESVFQRLELSDNAEKDDVMQELRQENTENLGAVLQLSLSYLSRRPRDYLVDSVLRKCVEIVRANPNFRQKAALMMQAVAALQGSKSSLVALEARQYLIALEQPSSSEQLVGFVEQLQCLNQESKKELLESTLPILHLLIDISLSDSLDQSVKNTAMSLYVERVYQSFTLKSVNSIPHGARFQFNSNDVTSLGSQSNSLTAASSFDDLSILLGKHSIKEINEDRSDTSSVGMELEDFKEPPKRSLPRAGSVSAFDTSLGPAVDREGVLLVFSNIDQLQVDFESRLAELNFPKETGAVHVVHVVLGNPAQLLEEVVAEKLQMFVTASKSCLEASGVRRITFAVHQRSEHSIMAGHGALFLTYRHTSGYTEDSLVRNIETPFAFQLDLQRLSNFRIRLVPYGKGSLHAQQVVHVYEATPSTHSSKSAKDKRYFVRALVRQAERVKQNVGEYDEFPGPETVFVQALAALESIQGSDNRLEVRKNHIYMNVLSDSTDIDIKYIEGIIRTLHRRYGARLRAQHVTEFEIRVHAVLAQGAPNIPIRVIASNPTGFALNIESYVEASDPVHMSQQMFYSVSDGDGGLGSAFAAMGLGPKVSVEPTGVGSLHGKPLSTPYSVANAFDNRRARAASLGTSFVFDFPELFRKIIELEWATMLNHGPQQRSSQAPSRKSLISLEELVLSSDMHAETDLCPGLSMTSRAAGSNTIGMVAWRMMMRTPEYPQGRTVILIANDITVHVGSFGTSEDELYYLASKYAREQGFPRLYIAANSGARIGIAEEVKTVFKSKWNNDADPSKGFQYLYVDEETYEQLGPEGRRSLIASKVPGTDHYRIDAVVGERPDLGVENLQGSGKIAGETSRAYDEGFTLSYVSGRCIGIGAYLVRLGQRVIQKGKDAPILLTGYQALNSLMGRDVYTSNLQLGGPKVMFSNGISHVSVRNDLEGVFKMVQWLSFVPERKNSPLPRYPVLARGDTPDRPIGLHPVDFNGEEFDPRLLLTGMENPNQEWMGGFFDKDSFVECLTGWAKTVIVGRARLGKIPMGVVMSEIRTVSAKAPADPAAPESEERIWNQAGQVWFPDSAYKTAQAINDFNREGLPLMIFANWRGFSGGQRDMFDSVLKYGAFIVDALVAYKQPVFVYIPPGGELRGGAWVVVDPTINSAMMEMYSSPEGRGGVLEPSGIVSIKFRKKDLISTAHRLDDILISLDSQLREADVESEASILKEIAAREEQLMPIYHQIAIQFADLHDRPGRMLAKGVIRDVVPWANARKYFYFRLTRKLSELSFLDKISKTDIAASLSTLETIFLESTSVAVPDWLNDVIVSEWLSSKEADQAIQSYITAAQSEFIENQVIELGQKDSTAILKGLLGLVGKLQEDGKLEERAALVQMLRRGVFLLN